MKTRFSFVGLVIGIVLLFAVESRATTRTVTSLGDGGAGTLRDAVQASDNGDTINFSVTGVISLTSGQLLITKSITIIGPGENLLEVTRGSANDARIFELDAGNTSISGLALTNGFAGGGLNNSQGGAIALFGGNLTISDCLISGNTAQFDGGAIAAGFGNLTVKNCTFSGNITSDSGGTGGAIFMEGGVVVMVTNSTFSGNTTITEGGAIFNYSSTLTVSNSTFSGNSAGTLGGGVYNYDGTLTLTNCTLSGNSASTGGGIYSEGSGDTFTANATLSSCTLSNNSASNGGGIYNTGTDSGNAFVTLKNTILFSTNSTPGANLVNVGGGTSISSQGYNLSSDNGGGFLTAAGDQINTDPKLGPLQNNFGPVPTMALLDGSPAWDKGKNFGVTTDARGLPRPYDDVILTNANGGDGSDIGAVEMQAGPSFVVTTTDDHNDGVCDGSDCTLREAINAANAKNGADVITFKNSVKGTITLQSGLGTLTVSDSVTIIGPGARSLSVSGNNSVRVFTITNGNSAISGLGIINGWVLGAANSEASGGGIINGFGVTLSLSDCNFSGNFVQGGDSAVTNGNGSEGLGGAIDNAGTLTINRCTFSNNNAKGGVGGPGSGAVNGNVVGGAGGGGDGGAIYNEIAGHLTINNSTFSANLATGGKGGNGPPGIFGGNGGPGVAGIFDEGTTTITGCTFSGNSGLGGVGGAGSNQFNGGGLGAGVGGLAPNTTTVTSTIIAGNGGVGSLNSAKDVDGGVTSGGYNLIGSADHSSGFGATGDQSGTDAAPLNAVLGPLQNNGGKTDTLALLTNSPAINASNVNVATARDQRNYVRAGTPDIGAFEFNGKIPETLANISTRAFVQSGDNVMIGGFVITGTGAKKVIIRARGPSLPGSIANRLQDPSLELHSGASTLATNDNWGDAANHQEISDSGFAPSNPQESAILMTLNPGSYTAIVSGVSGASGVGIIEGYDLDHTTGSKFGNISTRAFVQTGDNIMIGGFIVTGPDFDTVIVRATGPSLTQFGVANAMQDPTLELHDVNGNIIATNDNWGDTQQAQIQATGFAPSNTAESAIVQTLAPGNYTAIVQGKNNTTGTAVVEVYGLN